MSRKFTRPNPFHPHNRLGSFRQKMKEQYRQLKTAELDTLVNIAFTSMPDKEAEKLEHPQHRHQKLEFLLDRAELQFKKEWATKYGWAFDDCYDDEKLRANVAAMQDAALKAEFPLRNTGPVSVADIPPPVNLQMIQLPEGGCITPAAYKELPEGDEKKKIWVHMNTLITALLKSGYAGVLGSAQGQIVDRRLRPDGLPAQQSGVMGNPPPLKVEHECPDGYELKEVVFSRWIPYEQNSYLKQWARVRLKDGTYDLEWRWPNADCFGPHKQEDVTEVQYCCAKEDTDDAAELSKL